MKNSDIKLQTSKLCCEEPELINLCRFINNECYLCSDYEEFLDDLEEDPALRQNVNIFRDRSKEQQIPVDVDDVEDPNIPHITLEEMLDDLNLEDEEMKEVQ